MKKESYKGTHRQKIWQHNSFFGHVGMGKAHMLAIINSSTATDEAKETAWLVHALYLKLSEQLKERIDANPR